MGDPRTRTVDLIVLMGPPGSGKSTLGNELNRLGIATYADLEPVLVERYGAGDAFAEKRAAVHEWIWSYYRGRLMTAELPVVMETTGISGREFLDEMCGRYRVLFVKTDTPKEHCVARVARRPKGRHVNDHSDAAAAEFFDYWHGEIAPGYRFALTLTGTDLAADVQSIRKATTASPR